MKKYIPTAVFYSSIVFIVSIYIAVIANMHNTQPLSQQDLYQKSTWSEF